jgi:delta 1-pyrroline-5-carboxylate dehydrogenase
MLTLGEAIPTLMAGNTVVIKPSETTPLTALLAQDICREATLPEGVLQVVTGYGDTGAALVEEVENIHHQLRNASEEEQKNQKKIELTNLSEKRLDPLVVRAFLDVLEEEELFL